MKDARRFAVYLLLAACLFGLSGVWTCAQWNECREMGLSRFYCVGHVLK